MKLNLPNKLTLLRIIAIPLFMVVVIFPIIEIEWLWRVIAAALFALISLTDMLDGKIARKYNLVTDFGKFLDPLADKMLVFGGFLALVMRCALDAGFFAAFGTSEAEIFTYVLTCASFVVIFREMAVTSLRLLVSGKSGIVVAAAWAGKVKTVTQIICVCGILLEGAICDLFAIDTHFVLSYLTIAAMLVMTVYSGWGYFKAYWPILKGEKSE